MQQLAGTDSYFLYTERGNVYNHVASLGIYDPSTAPGGKVRFKDILKYFGERLHLDPLFRRRLVTVPHGLDRPYWVDDPGLDLEFHVRHIALPQPGDWRQLLIQVARIHSRPLDRSRPLWEAYVIEGLDRIPGLPAGSFALYLKFHHASLDGQAGVALLRAVHSPSPQAELEPPPHGALYAERDPTTIELYSRALARGIGRSASISSLYVKTLSRLAGLAVDQPSKRRGVGAAAAGASALPGFIRAPVTRFNQRVSANRVVEAVALPLEPMRRARTSIAGVTINDLFLTIVGGALHKYLADKEELPEASLMALMPMSVRQEGAASGGGNQVGGVPVPLHTEIAAPLARLAAVHADAESAKRGSDAMGRGFLKSILDELPHFAAEAFVRYYVYPQLNVTVSNVRGPEATLYVAGARLVHFYPVSIATDYVGLNHTGFSYNGVMWITAVACRNMMPDPGHYADCLRASFDELMAAIDALPRQADPESAKSLAAKPRAKRTGHGKGGPALDRRSREAAVINAKTRKTARATRVGPSPPATPRTRRARVAAR